MSELDDARRFAAEWHSVAAAATEEASRRDALQHAAGWEQQAQRLAAGLQAPVAEQHVAAQQGAAQQTAEQQTAEQQAAEQQAAWARYHQQQAEWERYQAQQAQQYPPPQPAGPQQYAAYGSVPPPERRPAVWTRLTTFVLIGTVVAVTGILVVTSVLRDGAAVAADVPPGPSVKATTTDFLDRVIARDPDASELLAPRVAAAQTRLDERWGSGGDATVEMVVGDPAIAEKLDLDVGYEVLEVRYGTGEWGDHAEADTANHAGALLRLTYSFDVAGERVESSTLQELQLERAFYFASQEGPTRSFYAGEHEYASAVSPWRVLGFAEFLDSELPADAGSAFESTMAFSADGSPTGETCADGPAVVRGLSDVLRTQGYLSAKCVYNGSEFAGLGEGVDFEAVKSGFPVLTEASELPDLVGMHHVSGKSVSLATSGAPLSEVLVNIDGEAYVFVIATGFLELPPVDDPSFRMPIESRLLMIEKRAR